MTTKIEWAGSTLNTVAGCTPQGPECANCYAQNEFCVRSLVAELCRAQVASKVDDKGNNWPEIFARAATDVVSRWSARGSHEARGKLAKKHVADIRDVWPLPNVHLGVSVGIPESKHRIDGLRDLPAAVRFLSCEPLLRDLGSLDLSGLALPSAAASQCRSS